MSPTTRLSVCFFLVFALLGFTHSLDPTPVVQTTQGPVRGLIDKAVNGREIFSFQGIPFAKPPVGELRFKDPVPGAKWEGTLEATKPGPKCPQYSFPDNLAMNFANMIGQEDCLFLNVFSPKLASSDSEGLPVMVYIHGGAYIMGDATIYPPFALLSEDVVLVVVQYRIGTLGFLSTEDDTAPGNLGLKDQSLALKWVQQNIATFGGDPAMVTIFGESAGGSSTHFHLLTDDSKGLFKRAILQSGTACCSSWSLAEDAREAAFTVGDHLNCGGDPDAEGASDALIRCLQDKPVEEVAKAYAMFFKYGVFPLGFAPIVDGKFLKEHPSVIMEKGDEHKVDLMAGVTRHDGGFMTSMIYSFEHLFVGLNEDFNIVAPVALGITKTSYNPLKLAIRFFKRYMGEYLKFSDQAEELTQLMGDRFFKICTDNTVLAHHNTTRDSGHQVFLYEFDYRGQQGFLDMFPFTHVSDPEMPKKWVGHVDDIAYLFPNSPFFKPHEVEEDKAMSKMMVKLWTNFAATGNPTPDASLGFTWEPVSEGPLRHLAIQAKPFMEDDQRETYRKFWNTAPLVENMITHPERFVNEIKEMQGKRHDEL